MSHSENAFFLSKISFYLRSGEWVRQEYSNDDFGRIYQNCKLNDRTGRGVFVPRCGRGGGRNDLLLFWFFYYFFFWIHLRFNFEENNIRQCQTFIMYRLQIVVPCISGFVNFQSVHFRL